MLDREGITCIVERTMYEFISAPISPENADAYRIHMSSGTSRSTPILTIGRFMPASSEKFAAVENLLLCCGSRTVRLSNVVLARKSQGNCKVLALDFQDLSPKARHLVDDFLANCVSGLPSFVARVAVLISPSTGLAVKTVDLSGERLTALHASLIRDVFCDAKIQMSYIAAELGLIARSCKFTPFNYYHPIDDVSVEVIDANELGIGDLLITKRLSPTISVERYRIGDVARFHNEPCACGAVITFELLGRSSNDYIKVAGALIRRDEFDRVAALFRHLFDDYRAEVEEVLVDGMLKGKITLRVYRNGTSPTPALVDTLVHDFSRQVFLTPNQTLLDLVEKGLFLPLQVRFVREAFHQKNKDVKLTLTV